MGRRVPVRRPLQLSPMTDTDKRTPREGSLDAPGRHPLDWRDPEFYDEGALFGELERVFDICHGCRRCFNLCHAFPTLFDLIDESKSMELDGVARGDYWKVVEHCYLCDMCFMTKCPYVPPHEWNVDFPHLMLRAKAVANRKGTVRARDRILSATDTVGRLVSLPVAAPVVNAANKLRPARVLLEKTLGVHRDARVPEYHSDTLRKRLAGRGSRRSGGEETDRTRGRVALFGTCYGNYNEPSLGEDLVSEKRDRQRQANTPGGQPGRTRAPSAGLAQPRILRRKGFVRRTRAGFRHLSRLPALFQPLPRFSDTV